MIRIGLSSSAFLTKSPAEVIKLAKELGFDAIEWGGDAHVPPGKDAVAGAVLMDTLRAGLTVAAYAPLYRIDGKRESGLGFEAILSTAVALHAPIIRVYAGGPSRRQGMPSADQSPASRNGFGAEERKALIAELRRLGDLADVQGVTICLSIGLRTGLDSYEAALDLVQEADHPFIRAAWEPLPGVPNEAASAALAAGATGFALLMARRYDRDGRPSPLRDEAEEWLARIGTFDARAGDRGMGRFVLLGRMGEEDQERLRDDVALLREISRGRLSDPRA